MIKKLFICPWFGDLPVWFDNYLENIKHIEDYGYDLLVETDLEAFNKRVERVMGVTPHITPGTGKAHDFRPALGYLFQDELKNYDFWGHTDFDCVYGRVNKFITDEQLENLDIHSNHGDYICGPWTLYRNVKKINELFMEHPVWKDIMGMVENTDGWAEREFTKIVDRHANSGDLRLLYTHLQGKDPNFIDLKFDKNTGILLDGHDEVMMFHFNRKKEWPLC